MHRTLLTCTNQFWALRSASACRRTGGFCLHTRGARGRHTGCTWGKRGRHAGAVLANAHTQGLGASAGLLGFPIWAGGGRDLAAPLLTSLAFFCAQPTIRSSQQSAMALNCDVFMQSDGLLCVLASRVAMDAERHRATRHAWCRVARQCVQS